MDKQQWIEFLTAAGVETEDLRENYATELSNSKMTSAMFVELNKFGDELKEFDHAEKEHLKNSPLKISPTKVSSPPKKRSKKEEFIDLIKTCKGDFTLLSAQALSIITRLEDKLTTLQKENDKVWSIMIVREQLENIEEEMNLVFSMPDKSTMIKKLKDDGYWVDDCLKNFRITKGATIHFVQWFYFLTYSTYLLCDQIREILRSYNVETVTFSALVSHIYSSTSGRIPVRIHHPSKNIGSAEIEDGLKMYGLTDKRLLECVGIFNEIKNLPLSSQKHNIASSPSSSRSSALMTGTHPPNVYPHSGLYHLSSSTGRSPYYYHPYRSSSRTRRFPYNCPEFITPRRPN